jgi:hypothetical protein
MRRPLGQEVYDLIFPPLAVVRKAGGGFLFKRNLASEEKVSAPESTIEVIFGDPILASEGHSQRPFILSVSHLASQREWGR